MLGERASRLHAREKAGACAGLRGREERQQERVKCSRQISAVICCNLARRKMRSGKQNNKCQWEGIGAADDWFSNPSRLEQTSHSRTQSCTSSWSIMCLQRVFFWLCMRVLHTPKWWLGRKWADEQNDSLSAGQGVRTERAIQLRPAKQPLEKTNRPFHESTTCTATHMHTSCVVFRKVLLQQVPYAKSPFGVCVWGGALTESIINIISTSGSLMAQAGVRGAVLALREGTFDAPKLNYSEPSLIMSSCQINWLSRLSFNTLTLWKCVPLLVLLIAKRCFVYLFLAEWKAVPTCHNKLFFPST